MIIMIFFCTSCDHRQVERRQAQVEESLRPIQFVVGDKGWSIKERMEHHEIPGATVSVVDAGRIIWTGYYGTTDKIAGQPINAQTLFQAASISKPVTALAALKLSHRGDLELDSNVNQYLSSWKLEENRFTEDQPVTLRHLLSHTAGISVHGFLGYVAGEPIPTLHQILDSDDPANSWVIRPIQAVGESFRYSGGGYCVVQQVLIDQQRRDFPSLMSQLVLEPLAMGSSTFAQPAPDSILAKAATGYLQNGSVVDGRRHIYPEMAAAGLWTTATDLAKFGLYLQKQYAADDAVSDMLTPFHDQVGLGMFLEQMDDQWYFQHGGWNEGFSSKLIFQRDGDCGAVVMINANKPDFIDEVLRSIASTYQWQNYLPPTYEELALNQVESAKIVGRYSYSGDQVISIFSHGDTLMLNYLNEGGEPLVRIAPNEYLRRNRQHLVRFGPDSTGAQCLYFELPEEHYVSDPFCQLSEGQKVPFDYILEGDFRKAEKAYLAFDKSNPGDPDLNEYRFYERAERLGDQNNLQAAVQLLKINTELHPGSATAFHRLADAYLAVHDAEEALRNYKKSVKFYPQNEEAKEMIEKLEVPKGEI